MLSNANRLNLRLDRTRLEKTGRVFHSSLFTFIYTFGSTSPSKFAILVSKRFHPHSSQRNQSKRLLTEGIRLNLTSIPVGLEVIIIPKRTVLNSDGIIVKKELVKQLSSLPIDSKDV